MNYDIHPSGSTPIFRQIIDQVKRFIASGQLRSGDTLPSVRTVALQHAINPMTVSKAYNMLESEGVLVRMRGVGMVIAEPHNAAHDKINLAMPSMLNAARVARQLGLDKAQALDLFEQAFETTENESKKNAD